MKLHLPITLLTAVLAAFIALPAQAVDSHINIYNNETVYYSGYPGYNVLGGAISAEYASISDNGNVTFNGTDDVYHCGDLGAGGAIFAIWQLTINRNRDVTFSRNYVAGSGSSAGGAILARDTTISHNGNVTFNDNNAYGFWGANGGAICATDSNGLTISNNKAVTFSENYAESGMIFDLSGGGAIYMGASAGVPMPISDNDDFSGSGEVSNYESRDSDYSILLIISNNGSVSFSRNYVSKSADYESDGSALGGAILVSSPGKYGYDSVVDIDLSIQGNDSVLFERNYEKNGNDYRLRSIYCESSDMYLSAKTGGDISIYDSIYTGGDSYFNSDYADAEGNTQSAGGDVIFSGKYAEQHLNEILAANNETRTATANEILNSQTSEIGGNVYVNGGSLQIVDGAVVKVNDDTVSIEEGSNATLAVSDAELVATNATIEVGASATLQLSNGASVTADKINIAAGATLAIGDIAVTTSAIDSMVAAYRISSLNVINGDLTFAAGSTLVTDGTGINMTEGSVLTFHATGDGEKINLVFTLGTEYSEDGLVQLFSNVDIVKFLMDGEEVDTSTTLLASDFFTGAGINENTTLHYDSTANAVYLQGVSGVVPEPTTATLSLLALAALAMRRRRK